MWGLYFAIILVIEKFFMLKHMERMPKVLVHGYVLLASVISFVILDAANMSAAFSYIGAMFGLGDVPLVTAETLYYLRSYAILLVLALVGATPVVKHIANNIMTARWTENTVGTVCATVVELVVLIGLFIVSTAFLVDGSFNPFLYFRF